MNHDAKTVQPDQPAKDIAPGKSVDKSADKSKAEQPRVEQALAAGSKSPTQQTANRMPTRADSLFTMGKRHV